MSSSLKIYNSLTRKKEVFEPIIPGAVGMYVCGPTVYSDVHTGNVRTFLSFDIVYRYLKYLGFKVRYVRNITDVGHLTDDADAGEDKILKKARVEQVEPMEIVQRYSNDFHHVMNLYNILPPSIEPTASGHIIEQIEMVKRILDKGLAYEVNGSVYFDVEKYNEADHYGILSGRKIDELRESGRELDGQGDKRSSVDFAIWKKAERGHIMRWPSPWGDGFPGWHLECSVMSTKYLGHTFDIHGGGMDLKFPHHECEIAQSKASDGHDPVRFWMHTGMLNFEGKKMSKSLGNSILPAELVSGDHPLLDKAYSPMTVRFLMLQTHYSSEIDFSNKALQDAEKAYRKLSNAQQFLDELTVTESSVDPAKEKEILDLLQDCSDHMNDDFNTPKTVASLFAIAAHINRYYDQGKSVHDISVAVFNQMKDTYNGFITEVLGLRSESASNDSILDDVMSVLIGIRNKAREDKDWATSDQVRDQLKAIHVTLKDNKDGTTTYEVG